MKFKTHNETEIDINMSHRVGTLSATYKDIIKVFGKSNAGLDNYKSDASWEIKFSNGTVATIYNYKNGKNYCGREGIAKTKIKEWSIGGFKSEAVYLVAVALLNAGISARVYSEG